MALPDRNVLLGMAVGVLCGMGVAAIGPGAVMAAFADETRTGIDPNGLVKFEGSTYDVQYDDTVDTTPTSKSRIKKVEFGRVSYVDITTTATGTYSTDAMFSNNIQYPGIEVNQVPSDNASAISVIGIGRHWVVLPLARGNSFVHIRSRDHSTFSGNGVTCVFTRHTTTC
ncbi:hypothetical protein ABIB57_000834 [Devosia sp. UYZn731]|uniref:hypothetical protein n=1 Tax=Devosia sp. UYZn731 TaxID=3156345 RepID=UPI003391B962